MQSFKRHQGRGMGHLESDQVLQATANASDCNGRAPSACLLIESIATIAGSLGQVDAIDRASMGRPRWRVDYVYRCSRIRPHNDQIRPLHGAHPLLPPSVRVWLLRGFYIISYGLVRGSEPP